MPGGRVSPFDFEEASDQRILSLIPESTYARSSSPFYLIATPRVLLGLGSLAFLAFGCGFVDSDAVWIVPALTCVLLILFCLSLTLRGNLHSYLFGKNLSLIGRYRGKLKVSHLLHRSIWELHRYTDQFDMDVSGASVPIVPFLRGPRFLLFVGIGYVALSFLLALTRVSNDHREDFLPIGNTTLPSCRNAALNPDCERLNWHLYLAPLCTFVAVTIIIGFGSLTIPSPGVLVEHVSKVASLKTPCRMGVYYTHIEVVNAVLSESRTKISEWPSVFVTLLFMVSVFVVPFAAADKRGVDLAEWFKTSWYVLVLSALSTAMSFLPIPFLIFSDRYRLLDSVRSRCRRFTFFLKYQDYFQNVFLGRQRQGYPIISSVDDELPEMFWAKPAAMKEGGNNSNTDDITDDHEQGNNATNLMMDETEFAHEDIPRPRKPSTMSSTEILENRIHFFQTWFESRLFVQQQDDQFYTKAVSYFVGLVVLLALIFVAVVIFCLVTLLRGGVNAEDVKRGDELLAITSLLFLCITLALGALYYLSVMADGFEQTQSQLKLLSLEKMRVKASYGAFYKYLNADDAETLSDYLEGLAELVKEQDVPPSVLGFTFRPGILAVFKGYLTTAGTAIVGLVVAIIQDAA
eukprot:m.56541 g.56541  ORF g.56541 m.56541 type:complete len:632 (-) comp18760_c0_seq1:36-1931(-)